MTIAQYLNSVPTLAFDLGPVTVTPEARAVCRAEGVDPQSLVDEHTEGARFDDLMRRSDAESALQRGGWLDHLVPRAGPSQFGIDEESMPGVVPVALACAGVGIRGIHTHVRNHGRWLLVVRPPGDALGAATPLRPAAAVID